MYLTNLMIDGPFGRVEYSKNDAHNDVKDMKSYFVNLLENNRDFNRHVQNCTNFTIYVYQQNQQLQPYLVDRYLNEKRFCANRQLSGAQINTAVSSMEGNGRLWVAGEQHVDIETINSHCKSVNRIFVVKNDAEASDWIRNHSGR